MKVRQLEHKNQFIITDAESGTTTFQSYNSTIAIMDKNGSLTLGKKWDYSKTTSTHLYLFLEVQKYGLNEKTRKALTDLQEKRNKRTYIQKLIDNGIIKYDEALQWLF